MMSIGLPSNTILKSGYNIWKLAHAERIAFLIDGENYFSELYRALHQAEEQIFILAWDIHSDMVLCPGKDPKQCGRSLHRLVNDIASQKPELQIYILAWDYSTLIYSLEREGLQTIKFGWMSEKNVHFSFDNNVPLGGSHHQKLVVIDDKLAFCGGMDLTISRWDQTQHLPNDALRVLPNGKHYMPFHDVQLAIEGEAASYLGELARQRWQLACHSMPASPKGRSAVRISDKVNQQLVIENVTVGISRTAPGFRLKRECREIECLYHDLIHAAKSYIYIENQYLTSERIVNSLIAVLKQNHAPEIMVVLPKQAGGWLEKNTMGLMQSAAIDRLRKADTKGKLWIAYPEDERLQGASYITVHSKVMIVDGLIARVGSSNLNQRSMGLDTECDIVIDGTQNEAASKGIKRFLLHLLADHWGLKPEQIEPVLKQYSLLGAQKELAALATNKKLLEVVIDERLIEIGRKVSESELLDMEQPYLMEKSLDQWAFIQEHVTMKEPFLMRHWRLLVTLSLALLIALAFTISPLQNWLDPEQWESQARLLGGPLEISLLGFFIFVLSGIVFIPLNLLIIVSASILPTWNALLLVFLGTLGSAASGYFMGRLMKDRYFKQLMGERSKKVLKHIRKGGLVSVLFVRLVPVAPHALVNLTAGFSRIKFWQFMLGTALGSMPGAVAIVVFQRSLIELIRDFSLSSAITLLGILLVILVAAYLLHTRFSRYVEG